jgi:ribosomal-protein-serine acetyltransferase
MELRVDDHIVLKSVREGMAGELFALVDSNRAHLRVFLPWVDHNTEEKHTLAFIKKRIKEEKGEEAVVLAIFVQGELAGLVSLFHIDKLNQNANMGYWIAEKWQGKGVMRKSCQALMEHAFQNRGLHRVELRCVLQNERSQRRAESLGFVKEGLLKGAIFLYGEFLDAYIYGKTK